MAPLSLRDLPTVEHAFSSERLLLGDVYDKNADGDKRKLPVSEKLALALNEIAAERRSGVFFYLPGRETLKVAPSDERMPASRTMRPPGARYCEIVYMKHGWDTAEQAAYLAASHRERHLKSSLLICPPAETSLFAVQFVLHENVPVYRTPFTSLTLYAIHNSSSYFVATTDHVANVVGKWSAKHTPRGADTNLRLNRAAYLYRDRADPDDQVAMTRLEAMRDCKVGGVAHLYDDITRLCRQLTPSFTASEITRTILATEPEEGIPLGTAIDAGVSSARPLIAANPPSRRGTQQKRARHGGE